MGNSLSQESIAAFADEISLITKEAAIPIGLMKRVLHPLAQAAAKAPTKAITSIRGAPGAALRKVRGIPSAAREAVETTARRATRPGEGWRELAPQALPIHLKPGGGGRASELAKRLARGGWTGSTVRMGRAAKYLPIGPKSMMLGFAGLEVPGIIGAAKKKPTATGEGGVTERGLGAAAGLGGYIAGGRRLIPALALGAAGYGLGGGLGRIIDRLRGGAGLGTAISAPSPEEAHKQLGQIQRYYG